MTGPVPQSAVRVAVAELVSEHMIHDTSDRWTMNLVDDILSRWRLVPVGSDDEIVLLNHEGLTDRQIGDRLGVQTKTAADLRRKLGLPYREG